LLAKVGHKKTGTLEEEEAKEEYDF